VAVIAARGRGGCKGGGDADMVLAVPYCLLVKEEEKRRRFGF